ncbi:MAG: hypothetical protein N2662_10475 [Bacteroidales bacterium]|nr:hypothetical protein [Bacteroidales bacterium]
MKKLLLIIFLLSTVYTAWCQDDIYYFPSKQKKENTSTKANSATDTSGMTAYEKYLALKEQGSTTNESTTVQADTENSRKPSYVVVNQDTTSGNVTINNYYFDDDRFGFYRRFYFDYYYPYYYDPFLWDYYTWWGYPYAGFYAGYYGYYGYWGYYWGYYPYYYPYYRGYWHGFYDGYYWRDYVTVYPREGVRVTPGRRMGGYVDLSRRESASYYPARFASNDYYHGTRRNGITAVNNASGGGDNVSTRRSIASNSNSSYTSSSSVTTTRPYISSQTRRTNYVPTYNTNTSSERRAYPTSSTRDDNYVVINNRRVRVVEVSQPSTPTPRRSGTSYTPAVRSVSNTSNNDMPARSTSTEIKNNNPSQPVYNPTPTPSTRSGGSESRPGGSGRRR